MQHIDVCILLGAQSITENHGKVSSPYHRQQGHSVAGTPQNGWTATLARASLQSRHGRVQRSATPILTRRPLLLRASPLQEEGTPPAVRQKGMLRFGSLSLRGSQQQQIYFLASNHTPIGEPLLCLGVNTWEEALALLMLSLLKPTPKQHSVCCPAMAHHAGVFLQREEQHHVVQPVCCTVEAKCSGRFRAHQDTWSLCCASGSQWLHSLHRDPRQILGARSVCMSAFVFHEYYNCVGGEGEGHAVHLRSTQRRVEDRERRH
jgi:hypothetical protein